MPLRMPHSHNRHRNTLSALCMQYVFWYVTWPTSCSHLFWSFVRYHFVGSCHWAVVGAIEVTCVKHKQGFPTVARLPIKGRQTDNWVAKSRRSSEMPRVLRRLTKKLSSAAALEKKQESGWTRFVRFLCSSFEGDLMTLSGIDGRLLDLPGGHRCPGAAASEGGVGKADRKSQPRSYGAREKVGAQSFCELLMLLSSTNHNCDEGT